MSLYKKASCSFFLLCRKLKYISIKRTNKLLLNYQVVSFSIANKIASLVAGTGSCGSF